MRYSRDSFILADSSCTSLSFPLPYPSPTSHVLFFLLPWGPFPELSLLPLLVLAGFCYSPSLSPPRIRDTLHRSGTPSSALRSCLTVSCFSTYSDPLLAFCLDAPGFVDGPRTSVDKSTGLPGFRRRRVVTAGRFGGGYGRDRDVPRNKMAASRPAVPSPERCRVAIVWRDDRRRGHCGCRVGHTGFRHPGLGWPIGTRSVHTEGSVGHNGAALEDGGKEMGWLIRGFVVLGSSSTWLSSFCAGSPAARPDLPIDGPFSSGLPRRFHFTLT